MTHEPECLSALDYMRACICGAVRAAYRRGYNDHAASRAHAEAIYGPYKISQDWMQKWLDIDAGFNQHGKGENP